MLDAVPELLFGRLSRLNYYKGSSQTLFYHMGMVNSARRAILSGSNDCDCGVDINYITEQAPFTCLEDKYIDSKDVLRTVIILKERKKYMEKVLMVRKSYIICSEIMENQFL